MARGTGLRARMLWAFGHARMRLELFSYFCLGVYGFRVHAIAQRKGGIQGDKYSTESLAFAR